MSVSTAVPNMSNEQVDALLDVHQQCVVVCQLYEQLTTAKQALERAKAIHDGQRAERLKEANKNKDKSSTNFDKGLSALKDLLALCSELEVPKPVVASCINKALPKGVEVEE